MRWSVQSAGWLPLVVLGGLCGACGSLLDIDHIDFADGTGGVATPTGGGGGGFGGSGTTTGTTTGGSGGAGGSGNAGGAGGTGCVLGPFGAVTELVPLNSTDGDWDPSVTGDQLTLYFGSPRTGTVGEMDIWEAARPTTSASFNTPQNVAALNTASSDADPDVTADGLTMYFASERVGGSGNLDIWVATRSATTEPFGAAQNITELNTVAEDRDTSVSADGLTVYFASRRSGGVGGLDIWQASRPSLSQPFAAPINLGVLNSDSDDSNPEISVDELTLFFDSERTTGLGGSDLWYATQSSRTEPFSAPVNLAELNTIDHDTDPDLSADGLTLYFASSRKTGGAGQGDLYAATRSCQ